MTCPDPDVRPEHFVARDRARRVGYRLEKVLQERRLAWRGEEIGMHQVRDAADEDIVLLAQDARESCAAVLEGRLRDRERGFLEIPFVVALTSVAARLERAARLEADRRAGRRSETETRREILALLSQAARRLEAFQATYDLKQPLPPAAPTDVGRILAELVPPGSVPFARPPAPIPTDAHALADLLWAARTAVDAEDATWTVTVSPDGRELTLAWGAAKPADERAPVPEEVERAAEVLRWLHPVAVEARARAGALTQTRRTAVILRLQNPEGKRLETTVGALAGGEGTLPPELAAAVRPLLAAPAVPEGGPVPPARLVALLGAIRALDRALEPRVWSAVGTVAVRHAAAALPREATRKAPLRRRLVEELQAAHPEVSLARATELADLLAAGRRLPHRTPAEAAVLLLLFARSWSHAGTRAQPVLARGDLGDDDVAALADDLATVARLRARLEGGELPGAAELTRLEVALIGALGRLARM